VELISIFPNQENGTIFSNYVFQNVCSIVPLKCAQPFYEKGKMRNRILPLSIGPM